MMSTPNVLLHDMQSMAFLGTAVVGISFEDWKGIFNDKGDKLNKVYGWKLVRQNESSDYLWTGNCSIHSTILSWLLARLLVCWPHPREKRPRKNNQ